MEFSIKNSTFRLQSHKSKCPNSIDIVSFCMILSKVGRLLNFYSSEMIVWSLYFYFIFLSRRSNAGSSGIHGINGSTQWQISQFATTIRPSRYPSEATTRGGGHYSMASMSAGEATWQGIHHQLTSPKQKLKTCHRHSRRRSLGSVIKTKRSKSCVNQLTVPTVTVWDEDDMKMTKTDEDAVWKKKRKKKSFL